MFGAQAPNIISVRLPANLCLVSTRPQPAILQYIHPLSNKILLQQLHLLRKIRIQQFQFQDCPLLPVVDDPPDPTH